MPKKSNKEQFIENAVKVHKDRYNYKLVEYYGSKNKVNIICSKHGVFEQEPRNHLSGQGCVKCRIELPKKSAYSQERIINQFKEIHGDKYDYSLVNYKGGKTEVDIICSTHGIFNQTPTNHLKGCGCKKCGYESVSKQKSDTIEKFIEKAIKIHGNIYNYNKLNYIGSENQIEIICPIHGSFWQQPNNHLQGKGCSKCGREIVDKSRLLTLEEFKERATIIHKNKYNYDLVDYINSQKKVKIICPNHGLFGQLSNGHLQGIGCDKCGHERTAKFKRENPSGYKWEDWQKSAECSKNFDSFKLYIIKCWNDTETFYKIGRTFTTVKLRFNDRTKMPYKYEVLKEIVGTAREICQLEVDTQKLHKIYKYCPQIYFRGNRECFLQLNSRING